MLTNESVKAMLAAAKSALAEEGFAWITKSALTERAYFIGLSNGLQAIAPEVSASPIVMEVLASTMFARDGDDCFCTSEIGRAYTSLKCAVYDHSSSLGRAEQQLARARQSEADPNVTVTENVADLDVLVDNLKTLLSTVEMQRAFAARQVGDGLVEIEVLTNKAGRRTIDRRVADDVSRVVSTLERHLRVLDLQPQPYTL